MWTSSAARAAASRRARAAGCASPRERGGARACRRRRRCRSRSRRTSSSRVLLESFLQDDSRGRLDQREVRERLREVAQVPARGGVELLGIEAERRGHAQEALHQVAGPLAVAYDRQRRDEPERADQEAALLAGQAVVGLVGSVTQDETVFG